MAVTILETLQNAEVNLTTNGLPQMAREFGKQQLYNAVTLLTKGYALDDIVEDILEEHGDLNHVPHRSSLA